MPVQFSYDYQIRRFVIQFIRMVSNFQVEFGKDTAGNKALQTIPVYYGDASRQAAMILRGNSENTLNSVPAMAVYIGGLTYERDRLQNPYHESTIRVREQNFDSGGQTYTGTQDSIYTVERLMPAPYKLTMKLDIWTSNTEQKHQILEQILPLFNPGLEIQSTDNYLDWTSLSVVLLTDVTYTSRTVPQGSDDQIDISSLTFEVPIWLTLPAKVKKMGVVAEIIASIYNDNGDLSPDVITTLEGLVSRQRFTPLGYGVVFTGPNILTLYSNTVTESGDEVYGDPMPWTGLVNMYGQLRNGISEVRLRFPYKDTAHELVGTVVYDPTDPTRLLFDAHEATKPANTFNYSINAIIDPFNVTVDSSILNPASGTKYLILNPIGDPGSVSAVAWQGRDGTSLVANANDIIEWTGNHWHVIFDSRQEPGGQYISNLTTTIQYHWNGELWSKSYEGLYTAGDWSLIL